MQGSPRKVPFRCPECGFVQQEPEALLSTYCRSCGHHYKGGTERPERPAPVAKASPLPRLFGGKSPTHRTVHCYRCGHDHEVSTSARSTICGTCNASIEFGDLVFSSNVSRPVDTRGRLHVTKKGYLSNAHVICGEAIIEGRINGAMQCEGTASLKCSGALNTRITADTVRIEKGANLDLGFPLEARELLVYGAIKGRVTCTGKVQIFKGGLLEGVLVTPSVVVEKGGTLLAESTVQPQHIESADAPEEEPG